MATPQGQLGSALTMEPTPAFCLSALKSPPTLHKKPEPPFPAKHGYKQAHRFSPGEHGQALPACPERDDLSFILSIQDQPCFFLLPS